MKVKTSRFGEIEVKDESLIFFPEGIIGFKDCNRFVIFDCGDDGVFKWLQSADQEEIAFVICEASLIVPDYQILLGQMELTALKAASAKQIVICLILCIPSDPQEMTANLLGPIVFNSEQRIGMQMVLVQPEYSTKFRVFKDKTESSNSSAEAEETSEC